MALAGNIIWWLTLSILLSLVWFIIGLIMYAMVITIPFGRACFTMAKLSLAPFGKDVISTAELRIAQAHYQEDVEIAKGNKVFQSLGLVAKIIWFPFGLLLAIAHAINGLVLCIPLITIPLAIQHFKLAGLSLLPVGKRVVTIEMARKVREAKAESDLKTKHMLTDEEVTEIKE